MDKHHIHLRRQHCQRLRDRFLPGGSARNHADPRPEEGTDLLLLRGWRRDDDQSHRRRGLQRPDRMNKQRPARQRLQRLRHRGPEPLTATGGRDHSG